MPIAVVRHQPFVIPLTFGMILFALWLQENTEYKRLFISCVHRVRQSMDFDLFLSRMMIASEKCLDDFCDMYGEFIGDGDDCDYTTLLDEFKPTYIN